MRTRKTAGSSLAIWLSDFLDFRTDIMAPPRELAQLRPNHRFATGPGPWHRWSRFLQGRPRHVRQHSTAELVREFVGPGVWGEYTKFAVERDPWDRIFSLWRYRSHIENRQISLDEYLDAIESGDEERARRAGAHRVSNWPSYTIDDKLAVDHMVFYESLTEDLARLCGTLGLPWDDELPHTKTGIRRPDDRVPSLTLEQIERIGRIFHREIELFGYRAPVPVSAPGNADRSGKMF